MSRSDDLDFAAPVISFPGVPSPLARQRGDKSRAFFSSFMPRLRLKRLTTRNAALPRVNTVIFGVPSVRVTTRMDGSAWDVLEARE